MNDLSISGKDWRYKNYDSNYVSFLKENYSLDEIVAKLISIRNINKEYVNSFLRPSIRDLIPNPDNLKGMDKAIERLIKAIKKKKK